MTANVNPSPSPTINLQTLVATIQQAVEAQNLIATNLKTVNATIVTFAAAFAAAFPPALTGSASYTPGAITSGSTTSTTVTVAGAALGSYANTSFSLSLGGLIVSAYVSATNTVTVVLYNPTGSTITVGAGTLKAWVRTQ